MKTILKVAAGILVAAVVLIGGCAALLSAGVHDAQKKSDKTAITYRQYRSVNRHDSLDDVKRQFGPPRTADEVDQDLDPSAKKIIKNGEQNLRCVYYTRKGHLASIFQFCFDGNGKYHSKSAI